MKIEINIPAKSKSGDVPKFLSKNLPSKAKKMIGTAIVYPNSRPSAKALFSPPFVFLG